MVHHSSDFTILYVHTQSCIGKNLLIDPVSEEESYQDGSLMITCMPSRNEVTQMTVTGEWSTTKINEVTHSFFTLQIFGILIARGL